MLDRRTLLARSLAAGLGLAAGSRARLGHAAAAAAAAAAADSAAASAAGADATGTPASTTGPLIERAIPSSGEKIPMVGLGSSATFSTAAGSRDTEGLKAVLNVMVQEGAKVFDTAPSYGASEEVAGRLARELGITNRIFWATKLNVAYGGRADPAAARAQVERSFRHIGVDRIDLIQVHNMGDVRTQVPILAELKRQGRVRYIGVTTTFPSQYRGLIETMRREPLDFVGVDYAIDDRDVEHEILPLAQEKRIGVLAYAPFGRTSLFRRVGKRPLPEWASELDARTWAQFFLKFVISHPAITAVTPATSAADHMQDDLAGGRGRLPDPALRMRMAAFIDALPGGR